MTFMWYVMNRKRITKTLISDGPINKTYNPATLNSDIPELPGVSGNITITTKITCAAYDS